MQIKIIIIPKRKKLTKCEKVVEAKATVETENET